MAKNSNFLFVGFLVVLLFPYLTKAEGLQAKLVAVDKIYGSKYEFKVSLNEKAKIDDLTIELNSCSNKDNQSTAKVSIFQRKKILNNETKKEIEIEEKIFSQNLTTLYPTENFLKHKRYYIALMGCS
jgi:hypothetical protein